MITYDYFPVNFEINESSRPGRQGAASTSRHRSSAALHGRRHCSVALLSRAGRIAGPAAAQRDRQRLGGTGSGPAGPGERPVTPPPPAADVTSCHCQGAPSGIATPPSLYASLVHYTVIGDHRAGQRYTEYLQHHRVASHRKKHRESPLATTRTANSGNREPLSTRRTTVVGGAVDTGGLKGQ